MAGPQNLTQRVSDDLSPVELQSLLASRQPVMVFDCSYDIARPAWGRESYLDLHIPGAVFADLDDDLSAPGICRSR